MPNNLRLKRHRSSKCTLDMPACLFRMLVPIVLLFFTGCQDRQPYYFTLVRGEQVENKTLLVVQRSLPNRQRDFFVDVYRATDRGMEQWEALVQDIVGPTYGTFVYKDPGGTRTDALGLIYQRRATFLRFDEGKLKTDYADLPFDWIAETGAQLEGNLYLFGAIFPQDTQKEASNQGYLAVAIYNGTNFEVLNTKQTVTVDGPSFWLKAVAHRGKIHLFWRQATLTVPENIQFEPVALLNHPLYTTTFDGYQFETAGRTLEEIPHGHLDVAEIDGQLAFVVQPYLRDLGKNPPPQFFSLNEFGNVKAWPKLEQPTQFKLGFKYFEISWLASPERLSAVRHNTQAFDLWYRNPGNESWQRIAKPPGLPENSMELAFFSLMVMCLAMIALGMGMAFRRRNQLLLLKQILSPTQVLAPVSLRMSAYMIDFILCWLIGQLFIRNLSLDQWFDGSTDFANAAVQFSIYLVYFVGLETGLGRTVGKWMLGLRVVTDKGERLTLWAGLVRNLVGFFERMPMGAFLAIAAIMFTPRNQRLGDLLARTIVVQTKAMELYLRQKREREQESATNESTRNGEGSTSDSFEFSSKTREDRDRPSR